MTDTSYTSGDRAAYLRDTRDYGGYRIETWQLGPMLYRATLRDGATGLPIPATIGCYATDAERARLAALRWIAGRERNDREAAA